MSHSIANTRTISGYGIFQVTVLNYIFGGESFTLAEFGIIAGVNAGQPPVAAIVIQPSNNNSLAKFLMPLVIGTNLILIQQDAANVLSQLPSTVGLNAVFNVVIFF